VGGITRGRIKVYIHEISMKLGEEMFRAKIAFAQCMHACLRYRNLLFGYGILYL